MDKLKLTFMVIFFFLLADNLALVAQNKENITKNGFQNESYFSADMYYVSDAVFMGRKDSIAAPYLYPLLTYHNKSGFYAKGAFSYLTKSGENRLDLFLASGGYYFTIDKLIGDISVTTYFFNDESNNVLAKTTADMSVDLSYDFDILKLSVLGSVYFIESSSSDFILSTELGHDFIIANNTIQMSPSIGFNFGSQNFYESYYTTKQIGSGNGNGNGNNNTGTTTMLHVQESEKFNLLAIEFSLPVWYSNKSMTLLILPTVVFPQNPSVIVVDDIMVEEQLKDTFYWIAGISYRF